ncbi:PAS domain S-box protein [Marispirochaeta aestuarii]|uniref:PAS domain S-box protein n=1 Tax=Marispirochaeta aestuarii TaxID=1963862 RepID=UPI0029C936BF|nr:PAS domain S-box protein [Marispirochaeta aestuarii]
MPKKILLVEDEAIIALSEARVLKKHNFIVDTAFNGENAIELVKSDPEISLVLMDINLGKGMDGTEAAAGILRIRDIPIIFLTSHSEKQYVDRVEQISGYGYVLKNSGEFVLIESIRMAYKLFDASSKIKESEQKYRAAFMTSPDSININRFDGLYVEINEGFTSLTGFTREDVIGRLSSEIDIWAIPEDREKLINGLKQDGIVENLESVFRCRDGSLKTGLMSARLFSLHGEPHILSITRDISEKKEIEVQLKRSEHRFKAIFEQAADGILIGNVEGIITEANRNMTELTGYSREELVGRNIRVLFDQQEIADRPLSYRRVYAGETVQQERNIRKKDGTLVPVIMNSKKVDDDCLQAIFHDISSLRAAEESLMISEERLRMAVEGSRDGLWDWNLETNEAYHSDRFARMLGYDPDELPYTSEAWSELLHPEDREQAFKSVEDYLSGSENIYESVFRMRAKDGSYRWISGRGKAIFNAEGAPVRFVGFNMDISGQKLAEEKYRTIVHTMQDGFLLIDGNAHITDVNGAYCSLTGFSRAELLEMSIGDIDLLETGKDVHDHIHRIMESGGETFETIHRTAGNNSLFVEISATPLPNEKAFVVIVRDITGRKNEEQHLQSLVEEKDYLMKEFSHRAKNNLSMILSLIRLKSTTLENQVDLSDIERHIEAINILNTRLYRGNSFSSINLHAYLQEVLETVFSFSSFPIRIVNDVAEISMDHRRAIPIALLTNEIAINALKHGFGEEKDPSFTVQLTQDFSRGEYSLTLSNSGRPFPEDVDFNDTRSLGMQLIPAFVKQLQGSITLSRNPVPVFSITFPVV